MVWAPGESGNPAGRPAGSKNKLLRGFAAAVAEADERGYPHPYLRMAEIANDPNEPTERRDMMLLGCAKYRCSVPSSPPAKIYVETPVILPHPNPQTIDQGRDNLSHIATLVGRGELDLDAGKTLIDHQYKIMSIMVDDRKLAIQGGEQGEQIIRIEGGLPPLPGTRVDMSETLVNGKVIDGHAIEGPGPRDHESET